MRSYMYRRLNLNDMINRISKSFLFEDVSSNVLTVIGVKANMLHYVILNGVLNY